MKKFKCLVCNSEEKFDVYNFGEIPLVNAFDKNKEIANIKYPLSVVVCSECKVCQLEDVPAPKVIFSNYKHYSSASRDNINHLNSVASIVSNLLEPGSNILEVGCNDGTLLEILDKSGHNVLGIDPAKNMASIDIHIRLKTIFENYGKSVINELLSRNKLKKFDCIVGLNVFAHFSSVLEACQVTERVLDDNGIFIFEVAYAVDTLFSGIYDTVYHEHVFNHTISGIKNMLLMSDLNIIGVNKVNTQGGSLRVFCTKPNCKKAFNITNNQYEELIRVENEIGVGTYAFLEKTHEIIKNSLTKIKLITDEFLLNKNESCFTIGAPARGVVIANTCGFIKYKKLIPIDDTADKFDKYFPGLGVKIRGWADVKLNPDVKKAILLSWNYKETMINKLKDNGFKGELLCYFPTVEKIKFN